MLTTSAPLFLKTSSILWKNGQINTVCRKKSGRGRRQKNGKNTIKHLYSWVLSCLGLCKVGCQADFVYIYSNIRAGLLEKTFYFGTYIIFPCQVMQKISPTKCSLSTTAYVMCTTQTNTFFTSPLLEMLHIFRESVDICIWYNVF